MIRLYRQVKMKTLRLMNVTASTDEDTPAMGSFMNDPTEEAVDTEDMDTERR